MANARLNRLALSYIHKPTEIDSSSVLKRWDASGRRQIVLAFSKEKRLFIKVGRGHRGACVGTWDLGTRDEGLEDIKYGTRGRLGRGRGDVKN